MSFQNKKSLKNYFWKPRKYDERLALTLYQKLEISELLSRLLALKNVELEQAKNYLNPTLRENLSNPYHLLDMDKAVDAVFNAIVKGEKICVFGDYDVDGATSSALLKRFFNEIGIEIQIYIPDRIEEGYGLNIEAIEKIKNSGTSLLITVDCGISSFKEVQRANEIGLNIIITDHHLSSTKLPEAMAVINPNRLDQITEHKNLAGVGVAFLFCVALNSKLREEGFYTKAESKIKNNNCQFSIPPIQEKGELRSIFSATPPSQEGNGKIPQIPFIKSPNLLNLLDLVALGTVCDVVPLTGLNRTFVRQGLKVLRKRQNLGIKTLADISGLDELIDIYHLGFVLGPRINAGGRVGSCELGSKLLCVEDELEALKIATKLNEFNKNRQDIEREVLEIAMAKIEREKLYNHPFIFVGGQDWHEGVIGIVASRIKDKYDKPTAILSVSKGVAKASCRSVHGVDLGSAILEAKIRELLLEGGGHAMAGGFMVEELRIDELHNFFCEKLGKNIENYLNNKIKEIDLILGCESLTLQLAKEVEKLGPYGAGNHRPQVVLKNVSILKADLVGENKNHLRLIVADDNMISLSKAIVAMLFNLDKQAKDLASNLKPGQKVSLMGDIKINKWFNSEKVQFIVEDVMI
jgi:single-stranded-DNA-specific exonuclease